MRYGSASETALCSTGCQPQWQHCPPTPSARPLAAQCETKTSFTHFLPLPLNPLAPTPAPSLYISHYSPPSPCIVGKKYLAQVSRRVYSCVLNSYIHYHRISFRNSLSIALHSYTPLYAHGKVKYNRWSVNKATAPKWV